MKKILKATLCISLAVLMGAIAPIIPVIMSKNRGLPAGFEAAYLPEEEDDYSGLATEPVSHNYDFGAVRPEPRLPTRRQATPHTPPSAPNLPLWTTRPFLTISARLCRA